MFSMTLQRQVEEGEEVMSKVKVLVVDDEMDVRSLMVIVLEGAGFKVSEMESGAGIMEKVAQLQPDVIVLDITMPAVNGLVALEQLKKDPATAGIPVLIASAQGRKSTMLEAKRLGATDFMVKPWVDGELEWRVQECLNRAREQTA